MFGITVFGTNPHLGVTGPRNLDLPYRELMERISAEGVKRNREVKLVFDQRFGAHTGIAIGIHGFLQGVRLPMIYPFPYFGVSHVTPCLQVADIGAYILGRRAIGDERFAKLVQADQAPHVGRRNPREQSLGIPALRLACGRHVPSQEDVAKARWSWIPQDGGS